MIPSKAMKVVFLMNAETEHTATGGLGNSPKPVYVLNGPNMNLLGVRQPELYGHEMLQDVQDLCVRTGQRVGLTIDFRQTNSEGTLIDQIQEARTKAAAIVINPAAYASTSVGIQDALHTCDFPIIEVNVTNTWKREGFRQTDYTAQIATAQINGCGVNGYVLALEQVTYLLERQQASKDWQKTSCISANAGVLLSWNCSS
jgi:3-dehydroquinate dehydratase II